MEIYIGEDANKALYVDLKDLGNLLLSGGPGGGKTVYFSRLFKELTSKYSPEEVKFVIYDSKSIDYGSIKSSLYLLKPITTDFEIAEFKSQIQALKEISKNRLNSKEDEPAIIVLLDEICVLAYWYKEFADDILEIAKDSSKNNIHFFIAAQRPLSLDKKLIDGIENKIAYWLFDEKESKDFIKEKGAEKLASGGDIIALINGKRKKLHQKPHESGLYL